MAKILEKLPTHPSPSDLTQTLMINQLITNQNEIINKLGIEEKPKEETKK